MAKRSVLCVYVFPLESVPQSHSRCLLFLRKTLQPAGAGTLFLVAQPVAMKGKNKRVYHTVAIAFATGNFFCASKISFGYA